MWFHECLAYKLLVLRVAKRNSFRFNFKDVDNRYQKKKPALCFLLRAQKTPKKTSKACQRSCGKHKVFIGSDKLEDLCQRSDITEHICYRFFKTSQHVGNTHLPPSPSTKSQKCQKN